MAGLHSIAPVMLPVHLSGGQSPFLPGQVFTGRVVAEPSGLALQIGKISVPIEAGSSLQPGEEVEVEVAGRPSHRYLRVVGRLGQSAPPSTTPDPMGQMLTRALELLGAARTAASARALLPPGLPLTQDAVAQVIALFASRGQLAADLAVIRGHVEQAARSGSITPAKAEALVALLSDLLASETSNLTAILRRWVQRMGSSVEARLAGLAQGGTPEEVAQALATDLRCALMGLLADDELGSYLRESGAWRAFEEAVARALGRLSGAHLQNLRGTNVPYIFVELPFDGAGGIAHGQIHVMGEGGGGNASIDKFPVTVVLDLSTSQLGDLWISLTVAQGRCTCTIRTVEERVATFIEARRGELAEGLADVGFGGSVVQARMWNGDRMEEAARLLSRYQGIDVTA